ncbi:NfeD-like C-terminal, partner-binding [Gracilibacillus orientalis]|uniref:NfeD-like C-terminal, partner-binding n=1 Tax=Gracilibacillus orientalis TaxID=334253 RepID=A0A1I4KT64_9BACI|nr:NfeD family protein [Gracilibacillus orientalis]SFL81813.1 NfeD-like C-terminal, partner-binding [Gracilibacillus orientalis]
MFPITADWMSFVIVALATLFLIGELLVSTKGIFSILGLGFITIYFASFLDPGMFFVMIIIYFFGLILMIIDGKILNDGTLAVIGLVCMFVSVGFTAPNMVAGLYAVIGVFIGGISSFAFLKVFKKRQMWTKITLFDQLTEEAGYSSINQSYKELVGKRGITTTDMRPIGTVMIGDEEYSAITQGKWVAKDTEVEVMDVDGTKILVKDSEKLQKKSAD